MASTLAYPAPGAAAGTPSLPLLLLQRLLALALLAGIALLVLDFPVAVPWLLGGLVAYSALLLYRPAAWLLVVPALLPVLDLTPWSGRLFFNEFDYLLLTTVAAGLWHGAYRWQHLPLGRGGGLLLVLIVSMQIVSTLRGLAPWPAPDVGAFSNYLSPYNSLRLAKGLLLALLLLPLLGAAQARGTAVGRLFALGMLLGLATACASILWERLIFAQLFNFDRAYRVTGLFAGMHTGGAFVDGYLLFALPFVAACFLLWRSQLAQIGGLVLLVPALYAVLVTFSRTNYLALGLIALVLLAGGLVLLARRRWTLWQVGGVLGAVLLLGALVMIPVLQGQYIQSRFATVSNDFQTRLNHWNNALRWMDDSASTTLLGMGKGSFPRTYYWNNPAATLQSQFALFGDEQGHYVRFSASDPDGALYLRQSLDLREPGPYQLSLTLRNNGDEPGRLLIEFCERNILTPFRTCDWLGLNFAGAADGWQTYHTEVNPLPSRLFGLWPRPLEIVVLNRGLDSALDVDEVRITAPSGAELLANAGFEQGMDHWFFSDGNHLAWHIKNLWLAIGFEEGLIGLGLFLLLLTVTAVRLSRRLKRGERLALLLMMAFTGFLAAGLFDSLFDEPRMTLLFYLGIGLVLLPPDAEAADSSGRWRRGWTLLALTLPLLLVLALAAVMVSSLEQTTMNPRFFAARVLKDLGITAQWLRAPLQPSPRYTDRALDGQVRPVAPRILLPELAGWSGFGAAPLLREREAQYRLLGLSVPEPCGNNSLPGLAACWLATGDTGKAATLRQKLQNTAPSSPDAAGDPGNGWEFALAYDLLQLDPTLTATEQTLIEQRIERGLTIMLAQLDNDSLSLWHGRSGMAAAAWLSAMALPPGAHDRERLRARAQGHFLETIKALELTEAWPEGYNYWINSRALLIALAGSAYLNGLEEAAERERVRRVLQRVGYWTLYATRPDNRIEGFADEGPRVDLKDETRRVIDLLAQATRDPVLAGYSDYLGSLHGAGSYHPTYRWGFRLFNDPTIARAPGQSLARIAQSLPTAEVFGADGATAYIRSGWDSTATFISFRAGPTFTHHGHYDAGHFTLFKGAPLALNSSTYNGNVFAAHRLNYAIRSVAKNTLLVLRPGAATRIYPFATGLADGGQRVTLPTGSSIESLSHWQSQLDSGKHLAGGRLLHYEHRAGDYTYIAADLSAAYGPSVRQIVRRLVYLPQEDRLLIADKVSANAPEYLKKWLLHTATRPQIDGLQVLKGDAENGILESSAASAQVQNGRGWLTVERLYPENAVMRLVGGPDYRYYVETDADETALDGSNFSAGASDAAWFDQGHWRIEIQPQTARLEDEFLVVLTPALDAPRPAVATALTVDGPGRGVLTDTATLFISDPDAGQVAVTLPQAATVRVVGLPPQATLIVGSAETAASAAGVAVLPLSAGPVTLRWR